MRNFSDLFGGHHCGHHPKMCQKLEGVSLTRGAAGEALTSPSGYVILWIITEDPLHVNT